MEIAISLPDELLGLIDARIAAGHYKTPSDLVAAALRQFDEADTMLKSAWDEGIASGEAQKADLPRSARQRAPNCTRSGVTGPENAPADGPCPPGPA